MNSILLLAALVSLGGAKTAVPAANLDPVVSEAIIEAPVDDVWAAFTTKAGIESWMVPHAEIDLKVGGKMLTTYNKDGKIGDDSTIENTIISYDPKRMLSIKATKAPKGFPFVKALENMWTVIYFEEVSPRQTRVICRSMGFTEDEQSQQMRKHFDAGNKYTIDKLAARFAKKP